MCQTGSRKCAADGIDIDQLHYLNVLNVGCAFSLLIYISMVLTVQWLANCWLRRHHGAACRWCIFMAACEGIVARVRPARLSHKDNIVSSSIRSRTTISERTASSQRTPTAAGVTREWWCHWLDAVGERYCQYGSIPTTASFLDYCQYGFVLPSVHPYTTLSTP